MYRTSVLKCERKLNNLNKVTNTTQRCPEMSRDYIYREKNSKDYKEKNNNNEIKLLHWKFLFRHQEHHQSFHQRLLKKKKIKCSFAKNTSPDFSERCSEINLINLISGRLQAVFVTLFDVFNFCSCFKTKMQFVLQTLNLNI